MATKREVSAGDDRGREAERPGEIPKRGWLDVTKRTLAEVKADHLTLLAAGVAFYAWIALFPALIALITVWGLVADPAQIEQQVQQMTSALPAEAQSVIAEPLTSAATAGSDQLTIGLIVSLAAVLWAASGGTKGLIEGINLAYDEEDQRKFLRKRGLALLLTLGGIVFVILAVALVAVLPVALNMIGLGAVAQIAVRVLRWPLLALLVIVALAVVYRLAPDRDDPKLRWVSPGAVVATILWLIGSGLFSIYVNNFGSYNETYGALAGVIALNLWLFLSSFIVLLGAELNAEMEAQTGRDSTQGEPRPMGRRDAVKADQVADTPRD